MDMLVNHFMREYGLSKQEAEELLNASMTDFVVMKSILQAVDRRVNNAAAS